RVEHHVPAATPARTTQAAATAAARRHAFDHELDAPRAPLARSRHALDRQCAFVRSAVVTDAAVANRRISGGGRRHAGNGSDSRVECDVLAMSSRPTAAEHDGAGAALRRRAYAARSARRAPSHATGERQRDADAGANGRSRLAFSAHARAAADLSQLSPRIYRTLRLASDRLAVVGGRDGSGCVALRSVNGGSRAGC